MYIQYNNNIDDDDDNNGRALYMLAVTAQIHADVCHLYLSLQKKKISQKAYDAARKDTFQSAKRQMKINSIFQFSRAASDGYTLENTDDAARIRQSQNKRKRRRLQNTYTYTIHYCIACYVSVCMWIWSPPPSVAADGAVAHTHTNIHVGTDMPYK